MSEVRIWNKALTSSEINAENHFYQVDPASAGLVAYWKFNEGQGHVVKDHTSNAMTCMESAILREVQATRPE